MERCNLCPRACKMNRVMGQKGYCGMSADIVAARAALHMWEEPCISGEEGSGTVFFSGCPLKCVYCQNRKIALGEAGKVISVSRLVEIFWELKDKKANNINLVTPTHFVPQIVQALQLARNQGLNLPVVYNTSSYENIETIKRLEGLVDIFLPDCKYVSSALSEKYSKAPDYFKAASAAIAQMVKQTGAPVFEGGLMKKGVIVRHLLLPGCTEDSKAVIRYLYETYGDDIYVSIMNQYTPLTGLEKYPEINRRVTPEEYDEVVEYAIAIGVENGFIQEGGTAKESFIPDFDCCGI